VLLLLLSLLVGLAAADEIDALVREGRWTDAVAAATAAADARPDDLDAHERLIDLQLSLGQLRAVVERYKARIDTLPNSADAWYLLGRAYTDPAAIRDACERALRIDPKHARAHMGLAAVLRAAGDPRGAAEAYQEALRLDPNLPEAWAGLLAIVGTGRDGETIRAVAEAAITAAPTTTEAWLTLAAWSPDKAGDILRRAVAAVPEEARAHAALAEQLLREGKGAEALSEAERALELDNGLPGARLARLYARSMADGTISAAGFTALLAARIKEADDVESALTAYNTLAKEWPRSPLPLIARAGLLAPKEPASAQRDLERALKLDPANDEAQAALGLLLRSTGDHAGAVELLKKATVARPEDGSLAVALVRSLAELGRIDEAWNTISDTERRLPLDPIVPITRAELAQRRGDREAAADLLIEAWDRTHDVRVFLALGAAAREAGRLDQALAVFDTLARQTGRADLAATADTIRAEIAAKKAEVPPAGG
jgi:tetratricopeptide (TPR) repeat protein